MKHPEIHDREQIVRLDEFIADHERQRAAAERALKKAETQARFICAQRSGPDLLGSEYHQAAAEGDWELARAICRVHRFFCEAAKDERYPYTQWWLDREDVASECLGIQRAREA